MTVSLEKLPKEVKNLPEEGQRIWAQLYNKDFGWRSSESHAEKAAWRAVYQHYEQREDGTWAPRG